MELFTSTEHDIGNRAQEVAFVDITDMLFYYVIEKTYLAINV